MSQNVEKDVRKLEERLTKTEMRFGVDALDRIYADDIMVTAPIGICVNRPARARDEKRFEPQIDTDKRRSRRK